VTVFGNKLNSASEAQISLTVIVTRFDNNTNVTSYENETDSTVTNFPCFGII